MKITSILACALCAWTWTAGAMGQEKRVTVAVSNASVMDREAEPVAVAIKECKPLKHLGWEVTHAEAVDAASGAKVPVQLDDMDGDREADEAFFLADVKAGETKTYVLSLRGKKSAPAPESETGGEEAFIYTALQLRDKADKHPDVLRVEAPGSSNVFNDIYMHGVTVESDIVGYRIYFDHRQNIDLYGKKKRRIELPTTQFYTTAEQLKEGYGVDVLWAGGAIGCGTLKDWTDSSPANWTDVAVRGQRVVTTGPLRTVVEVYDLGTGDGEGGRYDLRQRYTLCAHHRDMMVEVYASKKDKVMCTGVQKVGVTAEDSVRRGHQPSGFVRKDGLAVSWGCDYPDMGKKKIWAPEAVGLAVYVPEQYVESISEDDLNYLLAIKGDADGKLKYWLSFCAAMEEDGPKNGTEWAQESEMWEERLKNGVTVRVK